MNRVLLGLAAGVVATLVVAPSAFAHGGQYRAPGGNVPPGLREPSDPTPPPPPPPSTPPPTTTPPDTPGAPPPTPVVTPPSGAPAPAPVTTDGPTPGPKGTKPQTSYDQWIFWWNYNNDDILQIKESIYKIRTSPQSPLSQVGNSTSGSHNDATRATEKEVKEKVIPALRWAMDPANKQSQDTTSAGYIALAKITDDPSDIKLIEAAVLDKEGKKKPTNVEQIVNESAALALGLLRRTDESKRFDAKELDAVRDFLFQTFDCDGLGSGHTRRFAMLALGLLGDQPTTRKGVTTTGEGADAAGAGTTAGAIFERLKTKYTDSQMYIVSLLALSMQDPGTITPDMLEMLKTCTLKTKLGKEGVDDLVASYAALALGRIGTAEEIVDLTRALTIKQTGPNVKRSAAISLGKLGTRLDGPKRAALAADLWRAMESVKEASARNFGIMSLAYLLIEDIKAEKTDVINAKGVKVADELLKIAHEGRFSERPYGALAIGLVSREIGTTPSVEAYGNFRQRSIEILSEGLIETKMDKRAQGAFAVALGVMKEEGAKKKLVDILSDGHGDMELRGYAAVALGMIGNPSADVVKAIKEALKEKSSEELRLQCSIALGLLGQADAVPILIKELEEADTQNVQGQVVVSLAKIGDSKAIQPLVDLLKNNAKPDATRAISCAGLGLIGDLEMIPSLSHISKDINYRAACDVINEVLSIL
jgi:HEAT repeat protein